MFQSESGQFMISPQLILYMPTFLFHSGFYIVGIFFYRTKLQIEGFEFLIFYNHARLHFDVAICMSLISPFTLSCRKEETSRVIAGQK